MPTSRPNSVADARDRERQLLTRSIDLLATASAKGVSVDRSDRGGPFHEPRLDLASSRISAAPKTSCRWSCRANLISIGLWLLREAEEVRQGRSENFEGLIEVSQIIRDGIQ